MNKVNEIIFCREDYDTEQKWKDAVRDAVFVLLDAQYQMRIIYDEQAFGIIKLEFESADESLDAVWPYWLTTEQAERIMYTEDTCDESTEDQLAVTDATEDYEPVDPKIRDAVDVVYEEFWKDLITTNDELDLNKIKLELYDYKFILDQIPAVYSAVTNQTLSKPNYAAESVISVFNEQYGDLAETARLLPDDWDIITEECKTNAEYKKAVLEYLNVE